MNKTKFILHLVLIFTFSGCTPQVDEEKAVEAATVTYLRKVSSDKGVERIEIQKIVRDYAKVKIIPVVDARWDGGTVYLRKVNGKWEGLDFGTGIEPERLGIPSEAW
jgi:hypothetical protein